LSENPAPVLEAVIFAAGGPATLAQIRRVLPKLSAQRVSELVKEINVALIAGGRPYEIAEIAGGYQFRTLPEYSEVLGAARPERKVRLSRAALETLSVAAYKQPLTRAEIEDLRCVDCGAVLKGLLERNLIRIVGRRDAPGRPALYGTSATFLETFGLKSLRDLPELREVLTMDVNTGTPLLPGLDAALEFDDDAGAGGEESGGDDEPEPAEEPAAV
jgi:segregation and condensation protein B